MGYDGIAVWGGRPHMYRQDLHAQLPEIRDLLAEYGMEVCHVVPAQFRYPSLLASSNETGTPGKRTLHHGQRR